MPVTAKPPARLSQGIAASAASTAPASATLLDVDEEAVLDVVDVDTVTVAVVVESVVDEVEVDEVVLAVDAFPVETPPQPPRSGTTTVPSASSLEVHGAMDERM
jgi:hypothetical protein